ncbi:hypothetical protein BDV18DRAFT_98963 [Aspergillus unguis]
MLFNLGLTADAAAAHNSELVSQSETQLSMPSRHSSPRPFSFSNLPSWGLGSLSVKEKSAEPERPRYEQRRSMPITSAETASSHDDDQHSTAGPSPVRHDFNHQKYSKHSAPLRPKTTYQLAHPATNARHKHFKLRPKLLLQLQQVSSTSRPVPVFDVLPSTLFKPRLARKVPAILRGKRGLGPNDLIVTSSDFNQPSMGDADRSLSSDEENGDHREVVATICQIPREDAIAKGKAEITLNTGIALEATPLPNGSYEFAANTNTGLVIMRWVRRGPKKRRLSAPPGSIVPEDTRRFTFSVIDPSTRRHPVIASMARNHLEVFDKYSIPSTAPSSPTSAMSVISEPSELDFPLDQQVIETDEKLRLMIVVTSIWVAFREGWSHNFRYDDSAATGKCNRSASVSKTRVSQDDDRMFTEKDTEEKQTSPDPSRRIVTWTPAVSQSPTTDRSSQYGSLSKRSNSTGAAFIERSKRRNSSATRRSVLPTPRQSYDEPRPAPQPASRSRSLRKTDKADKPLESAESKQIDDDQDRPTKGKRRRRISTLFEFLIRKGGHHHE